MKTILVIARGELTDSEKSVCELSREDRVGFRQCEAERVGQLDGLYGGGRGLARAARQYQLTEVAPQTALALVPRELGRQGCL